MSLRHNAAIAWARNNSCNGSKPRAPPRAGAALAQASHCRGRRQQRPLSIKCDDDRCCSNEKKKSHWQRSGRLPRVSFVSFRSSGSSVSSPWYIQSYVACTRQGMVCTAVLQVHRKVMHWVYRMSTTGGGVSVSGSQVPGTGTGY